jgi:hypothetical protein
MVGLDPIFQGYARTYGAFHKEMNLLNEPIQNKEKQSI